MINESLTNANKFNISETHQFGRFPYYIGSHSSKASSNFGCGTLKRIVG